MIRDKVIDSQLKYIFEQIDKGQDIKAVLRTALTRVYGLAVNQGYEAGVEDKHIDKQLELNFDG